MSKLIMFAIAAATLSLAACDGVTITPREPFTADDVKR